MKTWLYSLLLLSIFTATLRGETLHLKNGSVIEAESAEAKDKTLLVRTKNGEFELNWERLVEADARKFFPAIFEEIDRQAEEKRKEARRAEIEAQLVKQEKDAADAAQKKAEEEKFTAMRALPPVTDQLLLDEFFAVMRKGDYDKLRAMLKATPALVNAKNPGGLTGAFIAVAQDDPMSVEILIQHGADPNAQDKSGRRLLHSAVSRQLERMVKCLLDNKADIEGKDTSGQTPLHTAAAGKKIEMVELLLERKADVNAKDNAEMTPLHSAAIGGSTEILELLCKNKANVNAKSKDGLTPLYSAVMSERKEAAKFLLTRKADVDPKMTDGRTPLYIAVQRGRKEMVELLLSHKADPNATSTLGTILSRARNAEIRELLIQAGAEIPGKR